MESTSGSACRINSQGRAWVWRLSQRRPQLAKVGSSEAAMILGVAMKRTESL